MTIEQLIDQLSTLGQTIGLKAEERLNIAERTNPMALMGVRATSGVRRMGQGHAKPVATITLT